MNKAFYEEFYIASKKVGAITCSFAKSEMSADWISIYRLGMNMGEKLILYCNRVEYRVVKEQVVWSKSYFEEGKKSKRLELKGENLLVDGEEATFNVKNRLIFPDFAYYLAIYQLLIVGTSQLDFDYISSQSGELIPNCRLEFIGEEDILKDNVLVKTKLIQESKNGKLSNKFWLGEDLKIVQSDWMGAFSYVVENKDIAVRGLEPKIQVFLHRNDYFKT
ncbi:MAG: hypothetical protein AB8B69_11115 [Chitinophagales bacterium]